MWLVGVVSRRRVWLVESTGVATGCGCKEVYRFPNSTYPYSSCLYLFFFTATSILFVHFLNVFRSCYIYYTTYNNDDDNNINKIIIIVYYHYLIFEYRITGYLYEHYIYVNMRVKLKSHKYNSHNVYILHKIIWYK